MKSLSARDALRQLGDDLRTARLKRRFAVKDFAARVGVSPRTVMRLERGEAGVGIGTLAMACLVLGEIDRLRDLFDPATDGTGLLLDRERLPKRISPKRRGPHGHPKAADNAHSANHDNSAEGVGF